jgi:hypothetical protein
MTAPDFSVDPNNDLIRRIIDARNSYERLTGSAPTCIYLKPAFIEALTSRGFKNGAVAGMKIIARPESAIDEAICSRDERLFDPPVTPKRPTKKCPA